MWFKFRWPRLIRGSFKSLRSTKTMFSKITLGILKLLTWKNIIRGICVSVCAILIRKFCFFIAGIDILEYIISNNSWYSYLIGLAYFITNFFIGLGVTDVFNTLVGKYFKESTTHFLGLSLGKFIPKNTMLLGGHDSEILEPKNKEIKNIHFSTQEGNNSPVSSSGSTSSRPVSPFSRSATPIDSNRQERSVSPSGRPDTWASNISVVDHNAPRTMDELTPEYFSEPRGNSNLKASLETTMCRLFGIRFPQVPFSNRITGFSAAWNQIDTWPDNAFGVWAHLRNFEECDSKLLKCMINRAEVTIRSNIENTLLSEEIIQARNLKLSILQQECRNILNNRGE